ncbi:unnamed protein product [Ostreobium quekettii]|uniref:Methyltransferase domain-containing protein n=1 Tax=Ostreobium quekettii TaxID=121088 RepID=A0A8S1JC35_9CHLO|nr:unnamed protein product [Ostreobium quekettii]|eukprot:evm.model.scf_1373.3 EVM.evm.TU.scf_1373.3   scf_1373:25721-28325(+)
MAADDAGTESHGQLADRFNAYFTGALTMNLVYIGDQLGLYGALKKLGKATSADLAESCLLGERWVREWLYQQASAKLLETDAEAKLFWMTEAQQDVLANEDGHDGSPHFLGGVAQQVVSISPALPKIMEAFRTGMGLKYDDYGPGLAVGVRRELNVWVRHSMLATFCKIPGLKDSLEVGVMVADIGCGCGEGLLTLAQAFPKSTFHGYDTSAHALAEAKQRLQEMGVTNAVFINPDEAPLPNEGRYDFMYTVDAVHDMAHPDQVLRGIRGCLREGARYLICDVNSRDSPAENIKEMPGVAAAAYGISTHVCLSSGLSEEGGMGLGTMGLTEPVVRRLAFDAGFGKFQKLHDFGRPDMNYFLLEA